MDITGWWLEFIKIVVQNWLCTSQEVHCHHYKKNKKFVGMVFLILNISDIIAPCT